MKPGQLILIKSLVPASRHLYTFHKNTFPNKQSPVKSELNLPIEPGMILIFTGNVIEDFFNPGFDKYEFIHPTGGVGFLFATLKGNNFIEIS